MVPLPSDPPRPRVLRERVLRDFALVERAAERRGFFAALVERVDDERLEPAPEDLARDGVDRLEAVLLRAVLLRAVLFRAGDLRAVVFRAAELLRVPLLRDEDEAALPVDFSSPVHLPDITRCAASATASAMIEPSFVALAMTLVAACDAVSAASKPASRIARRAFGLALIAAAAAARPAASISLLIAAFLILSVMSWVPDEDFAEDLDDVDFDEEDLEVGLLGDLAMAALPASQRKTLYGRNGSQMKRATGENPDMLKGTVALKRRCPSTWSAAGDVAVRQLLGPANTPFRPPC